MIVVSKQKEVGFPITMNGSEVVIMLYLPQNRLRFLHRRHRDTANAYIHPTVTISALVVIHHAKEIIGTDAQLIFRKVQDFVTRHIILSSTQDVSEIERSPSKQGQVFEVACTASIHHTDKITDARGVGRTRRKLVVNLVDIDDDAAQAILLSMVVGQSLCLFNENRRSKNQHIRIGDGVNILVGDALPILHFERSHRLEKHIAFLRGLVEGSHNRHWAFVF